MIKDTIIGVASGGLPSGVGIIRLSGPSALQFGRKCSTAFPQAPSQLKYSSILNYTTNQILDRGMVVWFKGPASFTGEDIVEFHCHGSKAVAQAIMDLALNEKSIRLAEAGEFTRRAYENGKHDLTEIEGLADLIAAETEAQRVLALNQASGKLRKKCEEWRHKLIKARAFIEAEFDFSDEEDVPDSMVHQVQEIIDGLKAEISEAIDTFERGEIIREGYKIALMGPPNAGKSSLMNALAKREVAIVTDLEGTTRDVLECKIDIGGVPVILFDTAGIREAADQIEVIGIQKALKVGKEADAVIWLSPAHADSLPDIEQDNVTVFTSKSDLLDKQFLPSHFYSVNVETDDGLNQLISWITEQVSGYSRSNSILLSRKRHKSCLCETKMHLEFFLENNTRDLVLSAEGLRAAGTSLGRLTGAIDTEELLDVIFSEFCVGK